MTGYKTAQLESFNKLFNNTYTDFYNNGYSDDLVYVFDERLIDPAQNKFNTFLSEYSSFIQDIISSDREAAAFTAAYNKFF